MSNFHLLERSLASVWHPCTQMKRHENLPLMPIKYGEGVWLVDFEGNRYMDAVSSWWVNLFGHCNPRINAAIIDQLGKLEHVMLAGFTHEPAVHLAERLIQLAPKGLGHCFYASDGASATEIALKMSAHFWRNSGKAQKKHFISLKNSYHGETLGALSVTDVALFKDAYGPLVMQNATVPSPDWREAEAGESAQSFALSCAEMLDLYLQEHHQTVAAFIVEPLVQGAAGMAMYHPDYLKRAREICDRYGVHLIADEIAVGMGRTGTMFACEQAGIVPDYLLLSKGITGGYLPLSVVMTTDVIYQAFYSDEVSRGFLHSHSYTGNPLACRAALATLGIFNEDNVINNNKARAQNFNKLFESIYQHSKVRNFRNTGMIWAWEVDTPYPDFAQRCFSLGLKLGVLLRPMGKTVYIMPPYVLGEDELSILIKQTMIILDQLT